MAHDNQKIICTALGFSAYNYSSMVLEHEQLWMQRYFTNNDIMVKALESSQSFWTWWQRQWELRDEQFVFQTNLKFIEMPLSDDMRAIVTELYYDAHNVMSFKAFPNKLVRLEAGREIIKQYEVIKNLKQ